MASLWRVVDRGSVKLKGCRTTMANSSTRESPPQPNEQPQLRRRNIYDYDGEYELPIVQHWTAPVIRAVRVTAGLTPDSDEKANID